MKILIKNGRMIDPANRIDRPADVLIDRTTIQRTGDSIILKEPHEVIDARR